MDGQGIELLDAVLKQRKEEKRKLEEAELSDYEKRKRTELSEREEYRQYLILKQMEIIWFSYTNEDIYKLGKIAEELLDRLATEHHIINYPKDYSLIREWKSEKAYLTATAEDRISANMKADIELELREIDKSLAKLFGEIKHGIDASRREAIAKEIDDIGKRQEYLHNRPTSIQELDNRKAAIQERIAEIQAEKERILNAKDAPVEPVVEPKAVKRGKKVVEQDEK